MNPETPETSETPQKTTPIHFVCGFLVGSADSLPGISGGTVAFILGIYERLVTAISHCDTTFFRLLFTLRLREAFRHIDLAFLITLLCGILCGIAVFSHVVVHLLEKQTIPSLALFLGLVFASAIFVFRNTKTKSLSVFIAILIGLAFGWWITGLSALKGSDALPYVFGSGMIAICAMILPGISGSYILNILGEYHFILSRVVKVTSLDIALEDLTILTVFALGCAIGLILFSKFLKWLLRYYHDQTLATLCGVMVGSLRKLWPFQEMVPDAATGKMKFIHLPQEAVTTTDYITVAVCIVAGIVILFGMEMVAARFSKKESVES